MSDNLTNRPYKEGDLDSTDVGEARGHSGRQPRARFAPEYEVLLNKLILARKSAGVTQRGMAKAIGKTQSHISMCENLERELSIIDLWKWCLAVGMRWSEFVAGLEAETSPIIESDFEK